MTGVSEIEYRVAREAYHLDQATRATSDAAARRHHEAARRCADYSYPLSAIEPPPQDAVALSQRPRRILAA